MSAKFSQRRGGHKAFVTKLIGQIDQTLAERDALPEELSGWIDSLTSKQNQIDSLNTSIQDGIDDETRLIADIEASSEFSLKISIAINKCKSKSQAISKQDHAKVVKLPTIHLNKFAGDSLEWSQFWDIFNSSIHARTDISKASKFQYLLGQLEGNALNLLNGFSQSDNDYDEAVDLLQSTYGKRHIIVQARINALLDLKSPEATVESLETFRSTFEGHLRSLKSLGAKIEDEGYVYAVILLRKLPNKTRDNIGRTSIGDVWTLKDLRDAISKEIEHLQSLDTKTDQYFNDISNSNSNRTAAFVSTSKFINYSCKFCKNDSHSSNSCNTYNTVQKRIARVKELRLCFNCLLSNHMISDCKNPGTCRNCNKKHNTALCTNVKSKSDKSGDKAKNKTGEKTRSSNDKVSNPSNNNKTTDDATSMTVVSSVIGSNKSVGILPTAVMNVSKNISSRDKKCYSIFDTGSQRCYIEKSLANELNLIKHSEVSLSIDGFESRGDEKLYDVVNLCVKTTEGPVYIDLSVVDSLPERLRMDGRGDIAKKLIEAGTKLADPSVNDANYDLRILIGVDYMFDFMFATKISENVYGLPSKLGLLIAGRIDSTTNNSNEIVTTVLRVAENDHVSQNLDKSLENFWNLDSVGIKAPVDIECDAVNSFERSIKYENNKYTASLPWKSDHPTLPSNKSLAMKRLHSVWKSLHEKPENLLLYDSLIKEQLKLGFIEPVPKEDLFTKSPVHYLPHHSVLKDSVSTPLRIVYDCSSKSRGQPSLNDCLLTGPSMINELTSVIMRFRLGQFACISDIQKAYLQVGLDEKDRDCCRFFWPKDPLDSNSEIITYRFKVVLFGSTASQFLLNSTLKFHLDKIGDSVAKQVLRNIYIDNLQNTFKSEAELIEFYHKVTDHMHSGGFKLKQWQTNSHALNSILPEGQKLADNISNILGLRWNTNTDNLVIPKFVPKFNESQVITKRQIVSEAARVFDPLGFLLPLSVRAKFILQNIWKEQISWDSVVSESIFRDWTTYVKDLTTIGDYSFPRKIADFREPILHIFSDASTKSYGSVAYFVEDRNVEFIIAKSRLVPLKSPPSLPQLELTAINVSARLCEFIHKTFEHELKIKEVVMWSDSTIALSWIKSLKSNKPYVNQRVTNILDLCPDATFNHIPGDQNPSDLLTRGMSSKDFLQSKLWRCGPSWLTNRNN